MSVPVSDICRLQTADCRLQIVDCRLQTADCRLQTADCRLQTADCRLQTADCRLQIADCKLKNSNDSDVINNISRVKLSQPRSQDSSWTLRPVHVYFLRVSMCFNDIHIRLKTVGIFAVYTRLDTFPFISARKRFTERIPPIQSGSLDRSVRSVVVYLF